MGKMVKPIENSIDWITNTGRLVIQNRYPVGKFVEVIKLFGYTVEKEDKE